MRWSRRALVVAVLVVETVATPGLVSAAAAPIPAKVCVKGLDTASLSAFFRSGASGLVGGDYPRSYPMTDGKVLWLFQDAFVGPPTTKSLRSAGFAHNAALVQEGLCFRVLWGGGPWSAPASYLRGPGEKDLSHWWWPLDGEMGADGNLHVFAAEFVNRSGRGAAPGATPVAVWRAVIRPSDQRVLSFALAPDRGDNPLYGWAIASDDDWSYLYGNCYRQFTTPGYIGMFDTRCTRDVTVARVPRGHFEQRPQYWSGTAWVAGRAGASVVHRDGVLSNPLQVERFAEDLFVGVALLDDWFGSTVVAYSAPTPVGPFTRYASTKVTTNCAGACNVYFASLTPWREGGGTMQVAVSNFTWDVNVAFRSPVLYRPSVVTMPQPVTGLATFRKDGTMELAVQPAGVRAPVAAVALEVDVPSPRASGAMVLWPCGRPRPAVVSVWVTKGVSVSAMVLVAPGERGAVCLAASTHLEFVVSRRGWVDSGGGLRGSAQVRLLDSRPAGATVDGRFRRQGAIAPGAVIEVPARGRGGIAATASTVFLGIVAVGATRPGVVQVWACGSPSRHVVLSVQPGIAAYNSAVVPLSARGTFCLSSSAAVQLMVDASIWWAGPAEFVDVASTRVYDSSIDTSSPNDGVALGLVSAGRTISAQVGGGVQPGAALLLSVTTSGATGPGGLMVRACDAATPGTVSVPFGVGVNATQMVLTAASADGQVCLDVVGASVALTVDVVGAAANTRLHVEPDTFLVDTAA